MSGAIKIDKPNAKQAEFLKTTARHVGFGGSRGGGKSWAVRTKAKLLALRYAGIKIIIIRKTYPELEENHIKILRQELAGIATYNGTNKRLTFANGSTISFGYCANDGDLTHYQGTEWDIIFFDEATTLTEYQIKVIAATNRGVNNFPKRIYYTCNPGGPGHAYIKRLFIDRVYIEDEKPEDYVFIQSLVWDNEILLKNNPEYVRTLQALPIEKRKAWLDGEWNVYEGQVFSEFRNLPEHYDDMLWTHVINPFPVPREWKVIRCMDWGYSAPFAIYHIAVAPSGQKFVIHEFYGCTGEPNKGVELNHMQVAEQLREIENTDPNLKGRKITGPADPAIFSRDSHGATIADDMAKPPNYIIFTKAVNDRLNGKMQVHYHLAFDESGTPMLQMFNTCRNLIRTLPLLMYDEKHIEDVDTSMEDHAYDAIRYGLMDNPITPRVTNKGLTEAEKDTIRKGDPLNQIDTTVLKFRHF